MSPKIMLAVFLHEPETDVVRESEFRTELNRERRVRGFYFPPCATTAYYLTCCGLLDSIFAKAMAEMDVCFMYAH